MPASVQLRASERLLMVINGVTIWLTGVTSMLTMFFNPSKRFSYSYMCWQVWVKEPGEVAEDFGNKPAISGVSRGLW